jgi:hypothetical protein
MSTMLSRRVRLFVLATGVALLPSLPAGGHSGDILAHFAHVTVDGVMSPGEYTGASCTGPINQTAGAVTYTFTICEANDDANDYYAVTINDVTHDVGGGDLLNIFFDNAHDSAVEPCASGTDDWLFMDADALALGDGNYCNPGSGMQFTGDAIFNGDLAVTFKEGVGYTFEFSHPLTSGDPLDYALAIGDTVGFCFAYDDSSNSANTSAFGELQYPAGCLSQAFKGNTTLYGDVRKLNEVDEAVMAILAKLRAVLTQPGPPPSCLRCPPFSLKLEQAEKILERLLSPNPLNSPDVRRLNAAIGDLGAFINEVEASRSKLGRDGATADRLIAQAREIQRDLQALVGKLEHKTGSVFDRSDVLSDGDLRARHPQNS